MFKKRILKKNPRRHFIKTLASGSAAGLAGVGLAGCNNNDDPQSSVAFKYGVASGDPLHDRVILWSRLTPETDGVYSVEWQVATDEGFIDTVASGAFDTDQTRDYTIKVDVTGLTANTRYFYRFVVEDVYSETGQTKTLPQDQVEQIKLAVFSCANYPAGYFHVYAEAAKQEDIDAVIHLGDYIYEYGKNGYASEDAATLGRVSKPENEVIALDDYRQRYKQYRSDPDLQTLHAKVPFINVWDDHEFANDAYRNGAENHDNATEGDYFTRQANALKAYYEWIPIREQDMTQPLRIYRSFAFGNLLHLHMMDTRVIGRDRQLSYVDYINEQTASTPSSLY